MPAKSTLTDLSPDEMTGIRFSKLQLWIRKACDNAGIGYTLSGLLQDVYLDDSEGVRFAKIQRWLALLANNITSGGGGGSGSGWDSSITSTTGLAAVVTSTLTPPSIKAWIQASDLTQQVWILQASTAADDPANGVVRPSDYGVSNQKVWFKTG